MITFGMVDTRLGGLDVIRFQLCTRMGGQVSCVRRRAFQHHRSGYSNTPFRTRSKDDLESDFLEIEATDTMPTAKKIAKPKGKLASWRYKKTDDAVVQAGQKDTNRKEKSPESMDTIDIPVVVATSPGSDIKCGCQVRNFGSIASL